MKEKDYSDLSNSELIQHIITKNNSKAFEMLYSKYKTSLFHYIKVIASHLPDETIFDLIQETFLKVYKYLPKLKDPTKFEQWLFKIAKNQLFTLLRREKKKITKVEAHVFNNIPDKKYSIEQELIAKEIQNTLNQFIQQLQLKTQIIFIKRFFENKQIKEIADDLNKTPRQIQYVTEKIAKKLKKYLKKKNVYYE